MCYLLLHERNKHDQHKLRLQNIGDDTTTALKCVYPEQNNRHKAVSTLQQHKAHETITGPFFIHNKQQTGKTIWI